MRRALMVVLICACGVPNDNPAAERARLAVTRLPTCITAGDVGSLGVAYLCTQQLCMADPCCLTCTLERVTLSSSSGEQSIDLQRAREVLDLDREVSNCDATAIRDELQKVRMSFSDATCVRRD